MRKAIDWLFRPLEFAIVALLVAMVVMVFGNVVLRYGFNSGIVISEEVSRYFFVWLTFIGAVIALIAAIRLARILVGLVTEAEVRAFAGEHPELDVVVPTDDSATGRRGQ